MKKFLNFWLTKYRFQSVNSDDFKLTFEAHLNSVWPAAKAKEIIKQIDWEKWIKSPGLPPVILNFTTPDEIESRKLADEYIFLKGDYSPSDYLKYLSWDDRK